MPNQETNEALDQKALVTFGLITDIQYADVDDGMSYDKTRHRYYRNSLKLVREAVAYWKQHEIEDDCKFKFFLQLGDIIDLAAKNKNESAESLQAVMIELDKLVLNEPIENEPKLLHLWGNHEMYNFQRKELINSVLNTAKSLQQNHLLNTNCYTYDVTENLRLICLDNYKSSLLGYEETDNEYIKALQLLQIKNKNDNLNSPNGLQDFDTRWCKFNGGLGEEQLKWLEQQLAECKKLNKKAIICGHIPVHYQAAEHLCLAWDYEQVLEIMWSYEKTVIAYFAGHFHDGGYFKDEHNIHHLTFRAILETEPTCNSFAIVKVFANHISIKTTENNYDIYFE